MLYSNTDFPPLRGGGQSPISQTRGVCNSSHNGPNGHITLTWPELNSNPQKPPVFKMKFQVIWSFAPPPFVCYHESFWTDWNDSYTSKTSFIIYLLLIFTKKAEMSPIKSVVSSMCVYPSSLWLCTCKLTYTLDYQPWYINLHSLNIASEQSKSKIMIEAIRNILIILPHPSILLQLYPFQRLWIQPWEIM